MTPEAETETGCLVSLWSTIKEEGVCLCFPLRLYLYLLLHLRLHLHLLLHLHLRLRPNVLGSVPVSESNHWCLN